MRCSRQTIRVPQPPAYGYLRIDGSQFLKYMRDRMGVEIAGGQDHLKGKIVRISHIGYAGPFDVITAVSTLEMAFSRYGCELQLGQWRTRGRRSIA